MFDMNISLLTVGQFSLIYGNIATKYHFEVSTIYAGRVRRELRQLFQIVADDFIQMVTKRPKHLGCYRQISQKKPS